jgi:hypothetical protein
MRAFDMIIIRHDGLMQGINSQPTMDEGGVKVCNVAAGETQDFNLGELPICRFSGNQSAQCAHGAVHAANTTKAAWSLVLDASHFHLLSHSIGVRARSITQSLGRCDFAILYNVGAGECLLRHLEFDDTQ